MSTVFLSLCTIKQRSKKDQRKIKGKSKEALPTEVEAIVFLARNNVAHSSEGTCGSDSG